MKSVFSVGIIFLGLSYAVAQNAEVKMPKEVTAGKNVTITVMVDKAPSVERTSLSVTISPKDAKDNPAPFGLTLNQQKDNPKVYSNTGMVPETAKGVWYIQQVNLNIPAGGSLSLEINHPEFTIKPIPLTLPTSGKVEVVPQ